MAVEIRVPTLGESVTEATVASWFKQPGEAVAVDEMICELETDKVTVEVPSPVAGKIIEHEISNLVMNSNNVAAAAAAANPANHNMAAGGGPPPPPPQRYNRASYYW